MIIKIQYTSSVCLIYLVLVPSAQGGVLLSPSKLGVEPSQQIFSARAHRPLPRPRLRFTGVLPSAQVRGLSPPGHGGVDLGHSIISAIIIALSDLSPSNTGSEPSEQVGEVPSLHCLPPRLWGLLPSEQVLGLLPSGQGGVDLRVLLFLQT